MSLWRKNEVVEVENVFNFNGTSTDVEVVQDESGPSEGDGAAVSTRRPSLSALLTEAGIASDDQIHSALEEGEQTGEKLGEVVVRRGWASEEQLAQLLAEQWGLPAIDPGALSLDPLAVSRIEISRASELGGFPVWFDQSGIVVAVAEPTEERLAAFRELLGNASFVVVPRSTLQELLESRLFGAESRDSHADGDGEPSGNGKTNGPFELNRHESVAEVEEEAPEESLGHDSGALSVPARGSIVDRLRSIEAEVQSLERALTEAERTVEAQEVELAEMRDMRAQDLNRIRHLESELDERSHRFQALREKVADLSLALDV